MAQWGSEKKEMTASENIRRQAVSPQPSVYFEKRFIMLCCWSLEFISLQWTTLLRCYRDAKIYGFNFDMEKNVMKTKWYSPAVTGAFPSCEPICVRCAVRKMNAKKWIGTSGNHDNESITSRLRFVRLSGRCFHSAATNIAANECDCECKTKPQPHNTRPFAAHSDAALLLIAAVICLLWQISLAHHRIEHF